VLQLLLVFAIQIDFDDLATILAEAETLAGNLGRIYNILEDGVVDGGQSAGVRPFLTLDVVVVAGLAKDAALGYNNDMLAAELLLQLVHKAIMDAMERWKQAVGYKDDDGFLAIEVNLFCRGDVEMAELALEVGRVDFEVVERLSDLLLKLVGLPLLLDDLFTVVQTVPKYSGSW